QSRFAQALEWSGRGLWASAASSFAVLSADGAGREADRNLGLCRLWLGDHQGAIAALRRLLAQAGMTPPAVDVEALCQYFDPPHPTEMVELVHWSWPIRNRDALLNALRGGEQVAALNEESTDGDEPESPKLEVFAFLDRPSSQRTEGWTLEDLPRVIGRAIVGPDSVALEAYDDGRLEGLRDRFTELVRDAIPPAHPRSKVVDDVPRSS